MGQPTRGSGYRVERDSGDCPREGHVHVVSRREGRRRRGGVRVDSPRWSVVPGRVQKCSDEVSASVSVSAVRSTRARVSPWGAAHMFVKDLGRGSADQVMRPLVAVVAFLFSAQLAFGQTGSPLDHTGFQLNRDYLSLQPWESIDTATGN